MHAAARVFEEHGYVNADVAMITDEAGKARGTFYIYFPSKPDVLRAMIDEFSSDLHGSGLDRSEHEAREMPTVLTVLWNNYRNHASTFRALAQAAAVDDGFADIYRRLRQLARRDFLSMMRRSRGGLFEDARDIEMAAAAMETMVCNLMYDWLAAPNSRRSGGAAQERAFNVMVSIMAAVMG
ncbi:MAG: TetR/AcrR family transcriptional regulator [Pseudomonadota bacterium]|nr:TetR/AcrR family transcriptional regulator [Pseudomonadota bacterium]